MQQWEYQRCTVIVIEADSDRLAEISKLAKEAVRFKKLGEQGWELVSVNNSTAYFKRELNWSL